MMIQEQAISTFKCWRA